MWDNCSLSSKKAKYPCMWYHFFPHESAKKMYAKYEQILKKLKKEPRSSDVMIEA